MMILLAAKKRKKKRDPVIMKRSERSDWLQNIKGDGDALRRFFSLDSFIFYFIFWTSSLPACYQVDGHIWVGFDLCPDERGPRKKTNKKYALDRQKRRIGKCTKHRRLQRESSERDSVQVKKESLYFSSFPFFSLCNIPTRLFSCVQPRPGSSTHS